MATLDKRLIRPVDTPVREELKRSLLETTAQALLLSSEIKQKSTGLRQLEFELMTAKKVPELEHPAETMLEPAVIKDSQLRLERGRVLVEEDRRILMNRMSDAFGKTDTHFQLRQNAMQRWKASETEVEARTAEFKNGRTPVNVVLQSQQRRMEASVDYFHALAEYPKSRSYIDYLSGTLLSSKNINLSEVVWKSSSPN